MSRTPYDTPLRIRDTVKRDNATYNLTCDEHHMGLELGSIEKIVDYGASITVFTYNHYALEISHADLKKMMETAFKVTVQEKQ